VITRLAGHDMRALVTDRVGRGTREESGQYEHPHFR
jgi:hypothetical protein